MTEAELIAIRDAGRAAANALSEIEHAREVEENKKLVGKCFKYRNSYSCPEKPSDYWWFYTMVIGMDEDGDLLAFQFERDKYGEIRISPRKEVFRVNDSYKECDWDEFCGAWHALFGSLPETPSLVAINAKAKKAKR